MTSTLRCLETFGWLVPVAMTSSFTFRSPVESASSIRIRIGSPTVVGTVTGDKRPVVVNDTVQATEAGKHGFNPLLPETRAEMGLPLVIGDEGLLKELAGKVKRNKKKQRISG